MPSVNNTAEQPISDSLVRKIQLLLNLGARSEGNEAEAAAAMAKAQELLAQYNLDLATVQDKVVAGGTAAREAESKRDYAVTSRSAMYQWQRNLVRAIAEANFCVYWTSEVRTERYGRSMWAKRHKVLGRVANTTAVLIMVDYLLDTIERLIPYTGKERLSRSANSWREGCAARLIERIEDKAKAMRTPNYATQGESGYTTAIQVADLAKKEHAANYDFRNGAGAWARKLASDAEWEANREALEAQWALEAKQREEAERQRLLAETPEQKAKREAAEAKQAAKDAAYSRRYWARQEREEERQRNRRDHAAYAAGRTKGESIGLDNQVGAGAAQKELR